MSRTVVIGANRGIGLELCKQLAARGEEVVAVCRSGASELASITNVVVHEGIDVRDRAALDKLAASLTATYGEAPIDTLIVMAGILRPVSLENFDVDSIREQFEVNALGALTAAVSLLPCLHAGSKIGLVTSRMGSLADNGSGGSYGYRMSKAALNMAAVSLAHDLRPREIAVRLLHPGWVRTEMTGGTGHIDAAESAAGLLARMDELSLATSGSFVHQNGEELPW